MCAESVVSQHQMMQFEITNSEDPGQIIEEV